MLAKFGKMFHKASILHSCIGSCRFTHWTPIAEAFNNRLVNVKSSFKEKCVGLFGIPQLVTHEGFYDLKEQCTYETNNLISEALSPNRKRKMVQVFDELSDTLCQVADMAEFIRLAHPVQKYSQAAETACVAISGLVEVLNTNQSLYNVLKSSYDRGDITETTHVDKLVASLFLFDFEQSGIHLAEGKRNQVVALNDAILGIGRQFVAQSSTPRYVPASSLPLQFRDVFPREGDKAIITGPYADSSDADIREVGYKVFHLPDEQQENLLTNLLYARYDLAKLCGFSTYSERALKSSLMEDPDKVMQFLNYLSEGIWSKAKEDFDTLQAMKLNHDPKKQDLSVWDVSFFTHRAKKKFFEVSASDYSPYFSLGACMEGLNIVFQNCFGISLVNSQIAAGEVWAPEVYKLSVNHETEGCLGYIYCDFYERNGKPNQDCHFTIRGGKLLKDGSYQKPIVVLMLNLTQPRWQCPSLLSPNMVDNLFHEMGHAMHSMLARTEYQHVTGTRCSTDLAEVPSILMEYFVSDPRVLKLFARHFQTKEPMPDDMLERLCASKRLFSASETQLQLFYSALDHVYHSQLPLEGTTTQVLEQVHNKFYGLPYVPNTAWQLRFSHLVGYGAKYYSYLVSRALAHSIWKKYFEVDPLNRTQGDKYREGFLAHGGGKNPVKLVGEFLEVKPDPKHLADSIIQEVQDQQDKVKSARGLVF